MLITYHEMDGCVLEACDQSETAAFVSIVSTIVAWASINDKRKKTETEPGKKRKIVQAVEVPRAPVIKFKPAAKAAEPKVPSFPKLNWV